MRADDIQLARAIQAGDEQVAAAFFEKYNGKIYRMMYFSSSNATTAEDLTRDTFVAFFASLPRFRGDARLSTWLYGIAKNVLKAYYARKRRAPTVSLDDDGAAAREIRAFVERGGGDGQRAEGDAPDELAARAETVAVVREVLGRLAPGYREVLILRYMSGLSTAAAAAALGKTEVATRVLAHRAAKAFVRELARLEAAAGEPLT